jgi:DNA polymerase-1
VRTNIPFGGPSGKVLDHLLGKYGVKRDAIITTNVVLCQSEDPPIDAIKACRPRLEDEIKNVDLVIAGGAEAVSVLTRYRAIHRARGFEIKRISSSGKSQRTIATNNPAAVLRDSDSYPNMVSDFRRAFDPIPAPVFPKVEVINDPDKARIILGRWLGTEFTDPIASDLEWSWKTHTIECAGFSRQSSKAIVFARSAISNSRNWKLLKQFYERTDIRFIWHNGKADTKELILNQIQGRVDEDTFLLSYALDERPGYHDLTYLLSDNLGWPDYEPDSVRYFKKHGEFNPKILRSKSERELYQYNGRDAAGTLSLYKLLAPKVTRDGVDELYHRLLAKDQRFRTVELNGFNFDVKEACNINEREAIPLLWELRDKLRELSGQSLLKPTSPKQMSAIYYDQWGLKHNLKDKSKKKFARSTAVEVREEIAGGRFKCKIGKRKVLIEFAETHNRFQKVQKAKANYLESLAIRASKNDGRIYCEFNIGGTVTGRASSRRPNMQNITREGVEGIPGIRELFQPSRGNVIISADYSQAELRTCAKLSRDPNLLAIYRDSSRSLHKERAAAFYGIGYTKEQYVRSKNINFGVTYGQSAASFAQMYHMPEKEAQAYINSWWNEFRHLKAWTVETARRALKDGRIQSPFGHKRRFHLITDDNIGELAREAVNFLPQNIAAWLTISSLSDLVDLGVRVLATVHDSIVAECPIAEIDSVAKQMKEVMEKQPIIQLGWRPDDIPFVVDISVGDTWGTVKEREFAIAA